MCKNQKSYFTFIVEPMSNFVTNNCSNRTVDQSSVITRILLTKTTVKNSKNMCRLP